MKRKVVQHGPSTLIVSLPSKWVKDHGIKKGDELDVDEQDKILLISAGKFVANHTLTQDVSGLQPFLLTRFLARSYQKGYDKIMLIHNDMSLLKTVSEKILELIGFEIIEQNGNYCLIQSLSSHIEIDFDNALRKAFLVVKQMIETCYESYKNGNISELQNLYIKDLEVNRFTYFCLRQINKEQYAAKELSQQSHVLYYIIEVLEDLGDAYKKLAKLLAATKIRNKDIINMLKLVFEQFDASYSYFYKPSLQKANQAYELYKDMEKKINAVVGSDLTADEILSVYHIKDASSIIYHFTTMRLDALKDTKLMEIDVREG